MIIYTSITVPPEAEHLRDALHEVAFWADRLLQHGERAKGWLDQAWNRAPRTGRVTTIIGSDGLVVV